MIWAVGDLVPGLALHAENDRCRNNDERDRDEEIRKESLLVICLVASMVRMLEAWKQGKGREWRQPITRDHKSHINPTN